MKQGIFFGLIVVALLCAQPVLAKDKTKTKKEAATPAQQTPVEAAKQEKEVFNAQQRAVQEQVGKLMQELHLEVARLQQQAAQLTQETRSMTVEMVPPKAGVYHLNFMDWVMKTLRDLKKTVNESRMWLHLFNQKKKQKGYWAMAKKHGEKFMFSEERGIATGVG